KRQAAGRSGEISVRYARIGRDRTRSIIAVSASPAPESTAEAPGDLEELGMERVIAGFHGPGLGDEHHVDPGRKPLFLPSVDLAQPPLHLVADDCVAHFGRNRETYAPLP